MANRQNTFLLKRSNVPGKIPSPGDLKLGEIALNTSDAILYASGTTANSILPIGWDRISRTGDTVTGNFNITGDVSISGSSLPGGYALSVTGDTNFVGDVYVRGDLNYSGSVFITGSTIIENGLTANTIYTDYIDFNTGATVTQSPGRINWDAGTGTLNIAVGDTGTGLIDLQVGQEEIVRVFNAESTTLQKGEIVYVSGSQGNRPSVKRAIATSDGYSVTTLGMVDRNIAPGSEGYVTTFGIISNLNTLGLTGGTAIFLSPTVAGGYTSIKPKGPNHIVLIGYVVRVSATVGSIFINISNGWELDELHDARISASTQGDLLMRGSYNGSSVWVNTKKLNGSYTITGDTNIGGNLIVSGETNLNNLTATTISATTYLNLPETTFTGGTVTGLTNFTNYVLINAISASTWLNLPPAVFTGGTVVGNTIFLNGLTANTFSAATYLNLPPAVFSGGTINGPTNFTNGLTANTFSAATYLNLPLAVFTSGSTGLYSIKANNDSGLDATGDYSVAEGYLTTAIGNYSHAEGEETTANGNSSHAEGYRAITSGNSSHAEGFLTTSVGNSSHSEGYQTKAIGDTSHSEGRETTAIGDHSHAEGRSTSAVGYTAHVEGLGSTAYADYSHAESWLNKAIGFSSHAEGSWTVASGSSSHTEGTGTTTTGLGSHAEGSGTTASGIASHAEGGGSKATGNQSHAEGYINTASGQASHSEGYSTTASGLASHAEGRDTEAIGDYSHAEGSGSKASGITAHAEGLGTSAFGDYSHSEGYATTALGEFSHAEGRSSESLGSNSHAGGYYSIASGLTSFIHSTNSVVTGSRSVVLGGQNITGSTNDTVYVPNLNINVTPNTNTNTDNVLVRNATTGDVEIRTINSLINTNNTITVALTGSTGVDFNSIKLAVESITGSSSANTYTVKVSGGIYYEDPFTIPTWVSVVGDSSLSTIIEANDSSQTLIHLSDQSALFDCQVQGCTDTGVSAIIYSSSTTPQSTAISYVENVRFGSNYTHAKVVAYGGANIIIQCSNVKYGGYPFTIGFYATNNGSGIGRMQLRNVTSTNGGISTTTGLIFAKADAANCGFIVNGCLLTKSAGAAAGTGFYVENGGFLRLTAVNFQRWSTGIYAPQIGSAPSIDAIALNFENCTTDVNIVHSGATGKIQGTDNFLKTKININSPLYEVGQDARVITVAKKGGDFSSIKSAVDYLIASATTSINSRYIIEVGPGQFIENEIDLTSTPYVSIVGSNIQTTQILPNTNNQHIIKIGQNNEVSFLSLSGAPSGYSGLYCYDIGDFAQAHKISFYDCDINLWVESVTQDTKFYGEYLDFNGTYTYGSKILSSNGFLALANLENYYNFPSSTGITYCNYASGSGATLSVFVADCQSNGVSGSTAYYIQDYAELNASTTTIDGFTYGVYNPNVGGGVRFDIDNASIVNGEWDLYIERVTTFGTFAGSSNHEKLYTQSTDVYWSFLDINDGEFDITRKASVTFADGTHTDFTTLIFDGSTMGVMEGGEITIVSGFTVSTAAGFGYLSKTLTPEIHKRIDWNNSQITLGANENKYIFINENGVLSNSGTRPNSIHNIVLGRVVTNSVGISFIDLSPSHSDHTSNRFGNLFREALGPIYALGSIVNENATPFKLDVTSGEYYYSTSEYLPSGGTQISFTQYYRDGLGGWNTSATTIVNNTSYDGNGSLSGLTTGYYTKHTLYVVGDGIYEKYFLVLGQNEYSTLVEAENALLPTPPSFFIDSVSQIANIYIEQGFSGITQIEDIRPVIGFKAGGVNASSVHGNLLGLGADDHTQYLLVNGGRAMSGNLNMGSNNITSVGTVDGVTVSAHATRHQFGGADQIGTTTPSANAIPYADVSGKLDSWVSTGSTTTLGKVKLSTSPVLVSNPIVVGENDLRFTTAFTGATFNNSTDTLTLNRNNGTSLLVNGFTDYYVTGGTYSSGTLTLNRNGLSDITINGFSTGSGSGTLTGSGITNKVAYWSGTSGLTYNINFHWDNSNSRLGIGTSSPSEKLDVSGKTKTTKLQVTSGATAGYVLMASDSNGNAYWSPSGGGGEVNTASNVGGANGIFYQKSGLDLQFRTLSAGTNVTITSGTTKLTINSSGEPNTASNLGSGNNIFAQKSGFDLQFRSIIAGSNITITSGSTSLTINSGYDFGLGFAQTINNYLT